MRRLAPFLGLSVVVHVLMIALVFGIGILLPGGRGLMVELYEPGTLDGAFPIQPLLAGFEGMERIKVFRIDFFKQIIPWRPPEPEPPPVEIEPPAVETEEPAPEITEPEPPEEVVEEPEEAEEEPVEEPAETPAPEVVPEETTEPVEESDSGLIQHPRDIFGFPSELPRDHPGLTPLVEQPEVSRSVMEGEVLPDALGVFPEPTEGEGDFEVRVFLLPDWELPDITDIEWTNAQFLGNYTIYMLADISRRHGLDDLLAWNYVLRKLITNPYSAYPPNVVTIGEAIENPYLYDTERIKSILDQAHRDEWTYGVQIADSGGGFARSLGYTELPQPVVIFADHQGFIRMILIGRVRDISTQNIEAAMDVIADMWQWTEEERNSLPLVVALLINMLRDQADDVEVRAAPPSEAELTQSPGWGLPVFATEEPEEPPPPPEEVP